MAESGNGGKPAPADMGEIASARRDIDLFSGWLNVLPNPDKILREQPQRGIRIYADMQRDAHIRSVFQTRRLAVVGKEWSIQPASDDAADQRVRDFVQEALEGITHFERSRYDLLDGIFKGFAVGEVMWAVRPTGPTGPTGRTAIVPTEIRRRGQHRFVFDFDGRPRLLTQANMVEGEELPPRKFLIFQYDSDPENPYGVGLGQSCYWPWWFKKLGVKFWVLFADRFGAPFPLGKFPPGTPKAKQDELLDLLKAFQQDVAGVVPDNVLVELLEPKRASSVDVYDPLVRVMNDEISKAVLGQTATVSGTPGSLGAETARAEVREDYVAADADLLDEVIAGQLIRWIVDFNFGPDVPTPWFVTKTEPEEDLNSRSERDERLGRMGLRIPARYGYDTYSVPEPEGDEAVLQSVGPVGQVGPVGPVGFSEGPILDRIVAEAERRLRG